MDPERLKAIGPWVLVKPEEPKRKTSGGLYIPDGNLYERLGHTVARVLSVGSGYLGEVKGKLKLLRTSVTEGDRVVFRGHLKAANRVGTAHCVMHMKDLVGVLDDGDELDLALPYDN